MHDARALVSPQDRTNPHERLAIEADALADMVLAFGAAGLGGPALPRGMVAQARRVKAALYGAPAVATAHPMSPRWALVYLAGAITGFVAWGVALGAALVGLGLVVARALGGWP